MLNALSLYVSTAGSLTFFRSRLKCHLIIRRSSPHLIGPCTPGMPLISLPNSSPLTWYIYLLVCLPSDPSIRAGTSSILLFPWLNERKICNLKSKENQWSKFPGGWHCSYDGQNQSYLRLFIQLNISCLSHSFSLPNSIVSLPGN